MIDKPKHREEQDDTRTPKRELWEESLGENSVAIHGEMVENKPTIPRVTVDFYTKAAPALLFSDKKDPKKSPNSRTRFVQGADWFDTKLKVILNAIRDDDPFADQLLLDIERAVLDVGKRAEECQDVLKSRMDEALKRHGAKLEFNQNMHASTYKLTFQNRLSYEILWAVKEIDSAFFLLFLSEKHALVSPEEVKETRSSLRRQYNQTLSMINYWTNTAITREDLAHNTARVHKTFEMNKKIVLSHDVLMLKVRATSAPAIKIHRGNELEKNTKERLIELYGETG